MAVVIKQSIGEKYNHKLIKEACNFFIDKLFNQSYKKMINKITITINPRSRNKDRGDCTEFIEPDGRYSAHIKICKCQPITDIISTLAHELVHLEQTVKKRLIVENDIWTWKGEVHKFSESEYKHLTYREGYNKLPWEKEAYDRETSLAKSFFNNHFKNNFY
jgi:hypothetical protein